MRGIRVLKVPCAPYVNHNYNNHTSTAATILDHKHSLLDASKQQSQQNAII